MNSYKWPQERTHTKAKRRSLVFLPRQAGMPVHQAGTPESVQDKSSWVSTGLATHRRVAPEIPPEPLLLSETCTAFNPHAHKKFEIRCMLQPVHGWFLVLAWFAHRLHVKLPHHL